MSRTSKRVPSYRLHKASGRAVVTLNGHDVFLGRFDTQESREKYDRTIAEWLSSGRQLPQDRPADLLVVELIARFLIHVDGYYRDPEGNPGSEARNFRDALRFVKQLYSTLPVRDFRPRQLKAVRQKMIEAGWSRKSINKAARRVKYMFQWAVEQELVPTIITGEDGQPRSFLEPLEAVKGLRKGKTEARETPKVRPVPEAMLDQTLPHLSPTIRAMVEVQRLTGMRPGELVRMRTGDINRTGDTWVYIPAHHKTEAHEIEREVYIGPAAQKVLAPFLKLDAKAFIFSPADAEEARRQKAHQKRVETGTPLSCGNKPGTNVTRRPEKAPGMRYTVQSYGQAITSACAIAFPPPEELARQRVAGKGRKSKSARWETIGEWHARLGPEKSQQLKAWRKAHHWHPHQLRHSAATFLRKKFGLDAAKVILGHQSVGTTEVYAEQDREKARQIMATVG